jgi:membrane-associated protein
MDFLHHLLDYLLHIDVYLNAFVSEYGFWTYLALFLVVFCETGLIVTPFLPGDSLLFAAGSIAAQPGSSLNVLLLFGLLFIACTLGNQVNYFVGRMVGSRILKAKDSWFLKKKHIEKTHEFYERHGGMTLIYARFMPIIRTFAPFVAGIGRMHVLRFSLYNLMSALLWVGSLLGLGYFLGSLPIVKNNFTTVIYGIIIVSLLPALYGIVMKGK